MNLESSLKDGVRIITPDIKRIDASIASEFKSLLEDYVKDGDIKFVINLSQVEFIDSSGLGVLVLLLRKILPEGRIKLCEVNEKVRSIFELTRLDKYFGIHSTEQDALDCYE